MKLIGGVLLFVAWGAVSFWVGYTTSAAQPEPESVTLPWECHRVAPNEIACLVTGGLET